MNSNAPYIANLVNSIIGVSVLAMPYCMKKCGLVLGLGLLLGASWLTYISCKMLVTSAVIKRRRTYEYLAFYTLGSAGKLAVELSMIGLMLGTCVAFYIIIGDLATGILSRFLENHTTQLRTFVIVFCALCIALPLGLMKSLSALGFIGFFSLIFYCLFVIVMLCNSIMSGLLTLEWWNQVELFRPEGVFQSLPIFSLAYACQCQLFVVYDSLEDPSVKRMESIVFSSVKIVTVVYCLVAIFGYTTFMDSVQGNVLRNLPPTVLLELIKLGFALSVVVGFPLMIFPCRQSIYTLFFKQQQPVDGVPSKTYIEPLTFKIITLCIVLATMTVAIMIPNVETILGLTGATMGSFICFILPAIIYSKSYMKGGGNIAKFVFGIGCVLLIVCTYSNLHPSDAPQTPDFPNSHDRNIPDQGGHIIQNPVVHEGKEGILAESKAPVAKPLDDMHRHEPANPIEPILADNNGNDHEKSLDVHNDIEPPKDELNVDGETDKLADSKHNSIDENKKDKPQELPVKNVANNPKDEIDTNKIIKAKEQNVPVPVKAAEDSRIMNPGEQDSKLDTVQDGGKMERVDRDVAGEEKKDDENKEEELLDKIKEQHRMQSKLLQEQAALIKALEKEHDKEHVEQAQVKPVIEKEDSNVKSELNPNLEVNNVNSDTQQNDIPIVQKPQVSAVDPGKQANDGDELAMDNLPKSPLPPKIIKRELKPVASNQEGNKQADQVSQLKDEQVIQSLHEAQNTAKVGNVEITLCEIKPVWQMFSCTVKCMFAQTDAYLIAYKKSIFLKIISRT